MAPAERLACYAVAAPGLFPFVAAELKSLGVNGEADDGGVAWEGGSHSIYSSNLWLRTATRVLVRVASFRAKTFFELERHARRIDWARWISPGADIRFRVTCRKSRLYHSGAVAQRLGESAERATGARWKDDPEEESGSAPLFIARFDRDELLLSLDSSGEPLYKRGYRQALAKAPLRETLASAMLMASDWRDGRSLIDPFCGSGTIPIEAAMIARRMAPGLSRSFGFQQWPGFDESLWLRILEHARGEGRARAGAPILGSDRDAGAIAAAKANAERAGVLADVGFSVRPVSAVELPAAGGAGALLTNPPYGIRVGDERVDDLYAAFGKLASSRFGGWQVGFLSADPRHDAATGLDLVEGFRTRNGGIPVRFMMATV
jgi:putative N6-adenine-specific DNA methylase